MIQADSGNERYKTCTGAIREAPRRKEKMKKKTIAILLVLVIGMVGVFANEPDPVPYNPSNTSLKQLELKTTVPTIQAFRISTAAVATANNANRKFSSYAELEDLPSATLSLEQGSTVDSYGYVPAELSATPYLTVANNSGTGLSIYVKADPLAVTGEGTDIDTVINYNVKIGDETISSKVTTFHTTAVMTVTADKGGLLIKSEAISVDILADDYDSAKASNDYVGVVYFNISAS